MVRLGMEEKEILEAVQKAKDIWAKREEILKGMEPSMKDAETMMAEWSDLVGQINMACRPRNEKG